MASYEVGEFWVQKNKKARFRGLIDLSTLLINVSS